MPQAVLAYNPVMHCASPDNVNATIGPGAWASDWRKRYFRQIGTVHARSDGNLVLGYAERHADDAAGMIGEMQARAGGVDAVAAACHAALVAQFGWNPAS